MNHDGGCTEREGYDFSRTASGQTGTRLQPLGANKAVSETDSLLGHSFMGTRRGAVDEAVDILFADALELGLWRGRRR